MQTYDIICHTYDVLSRHTMSYVDIRHRMYDILCRILILTYDVGYDIEYDIAYDIFSSLLLCPFRWRVSLQEGPGLLCGQRGSAAVPRRPRNTLLNDVFFYIMYHVSSFQNMHEYQVTKDTDIFEFVHTSNPAIPNSIVGETFRFSKEMVAYVETLVAFSPYYVAGDPRTQGRVDNSTIGPLNATRTSRTRNSTSTSQGRWQRSTSATASQRPKLPKSCRSLTSRRIPTSAMLFLSRAEVRSARATPCLTVPVTTTRKRGRLAVLRLRRRKRLRPAVLSRSLRRRLRRRTPLRLRPSRELDWCV